MCDNALCTVWPKVWTMFVIMFFFLNPEGIRAQVEQRGFHDWLWWSLTGRKWRCSLPQLFLTTIRSHTDCIHRANMTIKMFLQMLHWSIIGSRYFMNVPVMNHEDQWSFLSTDLRPWFIDYGLGTNIQITWVRFWWVLIAVCSTYNCFRVWGKGFIEQTQPSTNRFQ